MPNTKISARDDHDSAWKAALLSYLPRFFEFFFPELFLKIDWSKRPKFKDRELQALAPKVKGAKGGGLIPSPRPNKKNVRSRPIAPINKPSSKITLSRGQMLTSDLFRTMSSGVKIRTAKSYELA